MGVGQQVAGVGEHDQLGARDLALQAARMNVEADHGVAVAMQDD